MNPVGPEEPSVYWRRRLIFALGALIVLIILFMLLRSCSSSGEPVASPSNSASASASPSVTSSASPSGSSTAASGQLCADSDIEVTVAPNGTSTSYPAGSPITFTMSIKNISTKACDRNVGTKPNTVKVTSGGVDVWSSDDCAPPGDDNVKLIQPGDQYQLSATWDQKLSQAGCPANQPAAKAGTYEVQGINDQVKSKLVTFTIT